MKIFLNHMKIQLKNRNSLIYNIDTTTLRVLIHFNPLNT